MKKIILPEQTYFVTTNINNRFSIFVDTKTKRPIEDRCQVLIQSLNYYREKFGFLFHGFVFMPDHIHLILTVGPKGTIWEIMRDWKSRSAFEINRLMGQRGTLWQGDFWEHAIRNELDYTEKMNYIHLNPVRAGLVDDPIQWKYSSAAWYEGLGGPISIDE